MAYEALEDRRMYRRAEDLADAIREIVIAWEWFAKRSVGLQLAETANSIGANIAEAGGRFHLAHVQKFLYYSRGSLRETKYWLRRATKRKLLAPEVLQQFDSEIEQLSREINQAIRFQHTRQNPQPSNHHPTTLPPHDLSLLPVERYDPVKPAVEPGDDEVLHRLVVRVRKIPVSRGLTRESHDETVGEALVQSFGAAVGAVTVLEQAGDLFLEVAQGLKHLADLGGRRLGFETHQNDVLDAWHRVPPRE